MPIDININSAGDNEAELRRVFWGRSNKVVRSRSYDLTELSTISPPPSDMEAFIVADDDLSSPNEIAIWSDDDSTFLFLGAAEGLEEGWEAYIQDEDIKVRWSGSAWDAVAAGTGDMLKATYDPTNVNDDAFDQDNMVSGTTNKNFTATEQTKLAGIETAADVTDAGNVGTAIHGATGKTTPVDADELALIDSAASNVLKKVTWANTKATLKSYFDTLYSSVSGTFTAASTTEVLTGTDTTKGVTPDALAALWEKGSAVALAGTISLDEGGLFHIVTGTGPVTDIDFTTAKDGRRAIIVFDVATTLTHNGTTLICPGAQDVVINAGDTAEVVQDASDNVYVLAVRHLNGGLANVPFELEVAVSDETTNLSVGTAKVTFWAPMDAYISEVFIGNTTASTSGQVIADLKKNGVSMFTTTPKIDANEDTSLTGTAGVLVTSPPAAWSKGDKMTIDIGNVGTASKGLKMIIRGLRK